MTRDALRALSKARKRPKALLLGQLASDVIDALVSFYEQNKQKNILDGAIKNRVERGLQVENQAYFSENYAQVELQTLRFGGEANRRQDFTQDAEPFLMRSISEKIGNCYRTRISALKPGGVIPKHVDDPTQLRVLAVLKGEHEFTLFSNSSPQFIPMQPGELWFINTAWEHMVENTGDVERLALMANAFELPLVEAC